MLRTWEWTSYLVTAPPRLWERGQDSGRGMDVGQKDRRWKLSMRSRRERVGDKEGKTAWGEKQRGRWSEIAVQGDSTRLDGKEGEMGEKRAGWSMLYWLKLALTQVRCDCPSVITQQEVSEYRQLKYMHTEKPQVLHELEKRSEQIQLLTNLQPKTTPRYLLHREFIQLLAGHEGRLREHRLGLNMLEF